MIYTLIYFLDEAIAKGCDLDDRELTVTLAEFSNELKNLSVIPTVDTMQTNELEVLKNKYRILRRCLRQRIIQIAKQVNRDNLNSDFVDCAKCPFQADFLE